jgi:uncharacterized DUF497 family protein
MGAGQNDQAESLFEGIEFEWHKLKAEANWKKHKVFFDEAITIFGDENVLVVPDREHSSDEERNVAIGLSKEGQLITLCFTEREERLRIISARLSERWERREYEDAGE